MKKTNIQVILFIFFSVSRSCINEGGARNVSVAAKEKKIGRREDGGTHALPRVNQMANGSEDLAIRVTLYRV